MKSTLTILLLLFMLHLSAQQKSFEFSGSVKSSKPIKSISFSTDELDTIIPVSKEGSFFLKGKINQPQLTSFAVNNQQIDIWIDTVKNTYSFELTNDDGLHVLNVNGSPDLELYNRLFGQHEFPMSDPNKKLEDFVFDFVDSVINRYPASLVSLEYLLTMGDQFQPEQVQSLFQKLSPYLQSSEKAAMLKKMVYRNTVLRPGNKLDDFVIPAIDGKRIRLYDVQAKHILIVFWSSGCSYCRALNKEIKNIYATYHNKGLEIISISSDTNKPSWKQASIKDGITWLNVSELKGIRNGLHNKYAIWGEPFTLLLNGQYEIVLREPTLNDVLEEMNK